MLSPYFTKPADAVSDAVIAAIVLPEIHGAVLSLNKAWVLVAWKSALVYFTIVVVSGALAMVLRGSGSGWKKSTADSLYVLSTELGETSFVFSILFFLCPLRIPFRELAGVRHSERCMGRHRASPLARTYRDTSQGILGDLVKLDQVRRHR